VNSEFDAPDLPRPAPGTLTPHLGITCFWIKARKMYYDQVWLLMNNVVLAGPAEICLFNGRIAQAHFIKDFRNVV
jgi:hypothetical protein